MHQDKFAVTCMFSSIHSSSKFLLQRLLSRPDILHLHTHNADAAKQKTPCNASLDCSARANHKRTLTYITESIPCQAAPQPPVPVIPKGFTGQPHSYLEFLNGGLLPYHDRSKLVIFCMSILLVHLCNTEASGRCCFTSGQSHSPMSFHHSGLLLCREHYKLCVQFDKLSLLFILQKRQIVTWILAALPWPQDLSEAYSRYCLLLIF